MEKFCGIVISYVNSKLCLISKIFYNDSIERFYTSGEMSTKDFLEIKDKFPVVEVNSNSNLSSFELYIGKELISSGKGYADEEDILNYLLSNYKDILLSENHLVEWTKKKMDISNMIKKNPCIIFDESIKYRDEEEIINRLSNINFNFFSKNTPYYKFATDYIKEEEEIGNVVNRVEISMYSGCNSYTVKIFNNNGLPLLPRYFQVIAHICSFIRTLF